MTYHQHPLTLSICCQPPVPTRVKHILVTFDRTSTILFRSMPLALRRQIADTLHNAIVSTTDSASIRQNPQ